MRDTATSSVIASSVSRKSIGIATLWRDLPREQRRRIAALTGYVVLVTLLFIQPLARLFVHAVQSDLHSHIPLVPLIAGYLLFMQSQQLTPSTYSSSVVGTLLLGVGGFAALLAGIQWRAHLSINDYLAMLTFAYLAFIAAGGFLFLGSKWLARAGFPVAFLIFMVPLPDQVMHWLETALVLASAEAAALLFQLTGTPLLRRGTIFSLPGIVLEVARECSGIRSTWVLFMTSLLASHLFLTGPWRRLILVAVVIPLGIVRNAFRILVIGLLCVHIGPHMAESFVHTRGGPIFFVLSLVPLFGLLVWLRRREQRARLES